MFAVIILRGLYLIEILHQTTTCGKCEDCLRRCILSKFYIKPQPALVGTAGTTSCILSKFYIKPQHARRRLRVFWVVSYRNSTSNHNAESYVFVLSVVVSYRNSTSNHNKVGKRLRWSKVVSYRNSTSNHNSAVPGCAPPVVVSYRNSTSNHNSARARACSL